MRSKGEDAFNDYLTRIDLWFKNGIISYSKLERLKLSYEDYLKRKASNKTTAIDEKYWESFIQRQLKETQYISRKSREILSNICHNVWSTTGSITAQLRHIWGWDNVIEDLRIDQLRDFGLTTFQEYFDNDKLIKKEKIINWSKRDDQRHHAIDALTIACTKQSFIQRINTLNSTNTKNEIQFNIDIFNNKNSSPEKLLENYILSLRPFSTQQVSSAVKNILVSYKQGKKLATYSRRIIKKNNKKIIIQNKILAPRGALSEESIYGKIKIIDKNKPLKYIFTNPHLIVKNYIRNLVEERLYQYDNNPAEALKSLKKNPINLDDDKKIPLKYASCYSEQIVIKKNITSFTKLLQVYDIIDPVVRQKILDRVQSFDGNIKEALKNLDQNPIWYNEEKRIPINSVRCFTGLDAVEPLKFDENGNPISFVKPGNNHHLTLYLDDNNKVVYQICTFWHAVERKKFGFPVIIKNPSDIEQLIVDNPNNLTDSFLEKLPNPKWKFIESFQQNELFILNLPLPEFNSLLAEKKFDIISNNLYRLQNISTTGYKLLFRHHLATSVSNDFEEIGISSFNNFSFIKVKINYLGMITK
jgi:CRISPR-associated endonuclease Csn1